MPTLRTIIDGKDLTLGKILPRVKAATKPVNPADDAEDEDGTDDTTTHIAKHIQDPVGSTKQMFQDLTEKKLAYDMQKAITKQGLAPVKAILDHVEQTYELNGPNMITGPGNNNFGNNNGMQGDPSGGYGTPPGYNPNQNPKQKMNMQPGPEDARPQNNLNQDKAEPPKQVKVPKVKRNTRGGFSVHIKSSNTQSPRGIRQMESALALEGGGPGSGRHPEGGGNYAPTGKGTVRNAVKNLQPDGHRAINYNPEYAKSMAQHSAAAKYHSDAAAFYHDLRPGLANKHADAATAHRTAAASFGKGGDFKNASERARVASYNAHNAEETYQQNNLSRLRSASSIDAGGKGSGRYKTAFPGAGHKGGKVRHHERKSVEQTEKQLRAGGPGSGRHSEGGARGVRTHAVIEKSTGKVISKHYDELDAQDKIDKLNNIFHTQDYAYKNLSKKK